mmetsp:Transcript_8731/g.14814  ORF Transcript_8731/g.14814 Transcript_8731/m.14814 type:complete len:116 (-) Transcript_8731:102-449(-)|eukprot:CAMPEP_0168610870 /NCGR_PEP_ID=MMETSP0449_2-20121227/2032_1 /TAXON_ID=1082188 /ORGANISM="Strombidium rassoulzadegani, Strain ras09" /LENGTH=115 /DNA_ID=CAMNT_0008651233 /DNA_START=19 /DNA_END=366 /DNA_ORIENTATION=-
MQVYQLYQPSLVNLLSEESEVERIPNQAEVDPTLIVRGVNGGLGGLIGAFKPKAVDYTNNIDTMIGGIAKIAEAAKISKMNKEIAAKQRELAALNNMQVDTGSAMDLQSLLLSDL